MAPEKAHGKYLLSGGLLICPTCGAHFEARKYPWRGQPGDVYMCSTRRRKPGICSNTLALPIAKTDNDILTVIEGEVLGTRVINELLALVENTAHDVGAHLIADRDRLRKEVDRLVGSIAAGVPPESVAPLIKRNEAEISRIEARLRIPRPAQPNIEQLRAALEQRTAQWKADLRAEPKIARLLLRRLIGPVVLHDEDRRVLWDAQPNAAGLLDGIWSNRVSSLMPASWNRIGEWLRRLDALREAA